MANRSTHLRRFFARLVTASLTENAPRIEEAFASIKREIYAGPGPWLIRAGSCHVETPDDDLAFLYQDTLIVLDPKRRLNIGQPSSHARWLAALDLREGETVLQVGAGSGYYTAILAHLVGPNGRVYAFEIETDLAARAAENLKDLTHVRVHAVSGIAENLPKADAVYVCAGTTQPSWAWIDALLPGGRLMFPLQPERSLGGMLLITRPEQGLIWPARFVTRAGFVACQGIQDLEAGHGLAKAFGRKVKEPWQEVRSFRLDEPANSSCWYAGDGWWLSTMDPQNAEAKAT